MPNLRHEVTEVLRKRLQHAFKLGWGTHKCRLYSNQVTKNFYGDVLQELVLKMTEVQVMVEYASPKRVARSYGWYKEGEVLPIIAYFPYYGNFASLVLEFGESALKFVSQGEGNLVSVEFLLGSTDEVVVDVRDTAITVYLGVVDDVVVSTVNDVKEVLSKTQSVLNLVSVTMLGSGQDLAFVQSKQNLVNDVINIEIGDVFTIEPLEGETDYSSGTYKVLEVLTFGHNLPIGWVARVEPLREFSGEGYSGGIPVSGIDCLYFEDGKLVTDVSLIGDEKICVPWRVNPLNASNKDVRVELFGNIKWEMGRLSLLDPAYESLVNPVGGIFRVITIDGSFSFDLNINGVYEVPRCLSPQIDVTDELVSISCRTPGSVIKYSVDGEDPYLLYSEPLSVASLSGALLKVLAEASQFQVSDIVEFVLG